LNAKEPGKRYSNNNTTTNTLFLLFGKMSTDDDEHPLLPLLQERLPLFGLDVEAYGPYILVLFPVLPTTSSIASVVESDDSKSEIEGWDDVVELLEASSDELLLQEMDENVWMQLKDDLVNTWLKYQKQVYDSLQLKIIERENNLQLELEHERDLASINTAVAKTTIKGDPDEKEASIDDVTKRALLHRFGYEEDPDEIVDIVDANSNGKNTDNTSNGKIVGINTPSKREEQQKTKLLQQQKITSKEERRKRATKGERRR
jgi:hypothetical protein